MLSDGEVRINPGFSTRNIYLSKRCVWELVWKGSEQLRVEAVIAVRTVQRVNIQTAVSWSTTQ